MQVFNDAVIFAGDVDVQVGQIFYFSAGESGEGDDSQAGFLGPFAGAKEIGRVAGAGTPDGDIALGGERLERETENVLVCHVVADGCGQANVVEQTDGVKAFFAFDTRCFHKIGHEMTRGISTAAVAEDKNVPIVSPGVENNLSEAFDGDGIDQAD